MSAACWRVLGIDPVADRSLIRKAYARRLKAIDPEADPGAFADLREALDEALLWAQWEQEEEFAAHAAHGQQEAPVAEVPATVLLCDHPSEAAQAEARAAPAGSDGPIPDLPALDELEQLLFAGDPDQHPDGQRLTALVGQILNGPAMQSVDHAEWVERWLAEVIAQSIPRSDPVVSMVAEHFGWARDIDRWDLGPSTRYVTERHIGLALLARISDEKHIWHRAYLSLTSPEGDFSRDDWKERGNVLALLQFIRTKAPEAEGGLDPHRVALWEDGLYGPRQEGYQAVDGPDLRWNPWYWLFWGVLFTGWVVFLWASR